jgi:CDP-6-deoxy-D-xylo-4-hexulose-3-dehydrase
LSGKAEILGQIEKLTREYFSIKDEKEFRHGNTTIPLGALSYDSEEAYEAIESILTTWVTMGEKVQKFERMFAEYVGVSYGVMVNSGSSANLLSLSILTNPLTENKIGPGDEIITPAVTFATTVYPIINVGAVPVLVDIDQDTFNISVAEIEKAITPRTRAIMPVHLVGNPCDMAGVMEVARNHNLFVVEDACEAHGAEIGGNKVGSFGDLATFSFFFTHHISTIEGGMVLTNNEEFAEMAKSLRAFGWIRELRNRDQIAERHSGIDPRFLFINTGYNFRPTEIQGAFGIHQIGKLDGFVEQRRDNSKYWLENLGQFSNYLTLHEETQGTKYAWYAYPVTVKLDAPFTREELRDFLGKKGLETRPILTGNIDEQPSMGLFNYRKVGELPNSRFVQRQSFMFGNHRGIGKEEREAVIDYFSEFMSGVKS